jgi:hypothetical protein
MSFFKKMEDRKVKQVLSRGRYQWEGKDIRKGCKRVNMLEIHALTYENGKMRTTETISGMGFRGG